MIIIAKKLWNVKACKLYKYNAEKFVKTLQTILLEKSQSLPTASVPAMHLAPSINHR